MFLEWVYQVMKETKLQCRSGITSWFFAAASRTKVKAYVEQIIVPYVGEGFLC